MSSSSWKSTLNMPATWTAKRRTSSPSAARRAECCRKADIVAFRREESRVLPVDLDYEAVTGLSAEATQKLNTIRPATLGQAARIDGVTPAALTLVLAHVRNRAAAARVA